MRNRLTKHEAQKASRVEQRLNKMLTDGVGWGDPRKMGQLTGVEPTCQVCGKKTEPQVYDPMNIGRLCDVHWKFGYAATPGIAPSSYKGK